MTGFITGFGVGIVFTLLALIIFSKSIIKFAAKRSMKNLMVGLQGNVNDLISSIPIETDPDKIFEDNKNVKKTNKK